MSIKMFQKNEYYYLNQKRIKGRIRSCGFLRIFTENFNQEVTDIHTRRNKFIYEYLHHQKPNKTPQKNIKIFLWHAISQLYKVIVFLNQE